MSKFAKFCFALGITFLACVVYFSIGKAGDVGWPDNWQYPVPGSPITAVFGANNSTYGGESFHPGVDIGTAANPTADVLAMGDGIVVLAENYGVKIQGFSICVFHGWDSQGQPVTTCYFHTRNPYVKTGDIVVKGQPISMAYGFQPPAGAYNKAFQWHIDVRYMVVEKDPVYNFSLFRDPLLLPVIVTRWDGGSGEISTVPVTFSGVPYTPLEGSSGPVDGQRNIDIWKYIAVSAVILVIVYLTGAWVMFFSVLAGLFYMIPFSTWNSIMPNPTVYTMPESTFVPTPTSTAPTLKVAGECPAGVNPLLCILPPAQVWGEEIVKWCNSNNGDALCPDRAIVIMSIESCGFPDACSYRDSEGNCTGAFGLFQLTKGTFPYSSEQLFDTEFNGINGIKYIENLTAKYSGNFLAAAANYNGGPYAGEWQIGERTRESYVLQYGESKAREVGKMVEYAGMYYETIDGSHPSFETFVKDGRCRNAAKVYNLWWPEAKK